MDPSPTPAERLGGVGVGLPAAGVLGICLVVFLLVVLSLLCLRKLLQKRGITIPGLSCGCCQRCGGGCGSWCGCGESCVTLAERLDCETPDMQACLDRVCPTKQACSLWCGQFWSCYAYHMIRDQCQGVSCAGLCPACQACECPDFQCCGHCCHCKLKTPDCTHINCLFCDLDCAGDDSSS